MFRAMYAVFTRDEKDLPLPALVLCRLIKASLRKDRKLYAELACRTADIGGKDTHVRLIISVLRAVYNDHYDYWSRLRVVLCYTVVFAVRNYLDDHKSAAFVLGAIALVCAPCMMPKVSPRPPSPTLNVTLYSSRNTHCLFIYKDFRKSVRLARAHVTGN